MPTGISYRFRDLLSFTNLVLLYSLVTRTDYLQFQIEATIVGGVKMGKRTSSSLVTVIARKVHWLAIIVTAMNLKLQWRTDLSPNLTPLALKDLHIADDGSVSAIGAATLEGFDGERIV